MRACFQSRIALLTLSLFFTACEVGGEKRKVESNDSILVSYFFSEQHAINDEFYKNLFSFIYGGVGAADPASSTDFWSQPSSGCAFTQELDSYQWSKFGLRRLLDVGPLSLEGSLLPREEFKFNGLESIYSYFFLTPLQAGNYTFVSPGVSGGALKFQQNFTVLEPGSNLQSHRYDADGNFVESRALASPNIPSESDPNYRIIMDRSSDNVLSFTAPPGTHYVRARLKDGSNTSGGDITCFAQPDEVLVFPQGALYSFRTTSQAYLELDFVSVSTVSDINRLKSGLFISSMRHIHGTFEYSDNEGIKHTENVGLTEIR